MRKLFVLFFVISLTLGVASFADATPKSDTYDTQLGDFDAGTWQETFAGGGEGQIGNTIQSPADGAAMQSWGMFDYALYSVEQLINGANTDVYRTIYKPGAFGAFVLGDNGPWWDPADTGTLTAYEVDMDQVEVITVKDFDSQGILTNLSFTLTGSGVFSAFPEVDISVEASYSGVPTFDPGIILPGFMGEDEVVEPPSMSDNLDYAIVKIGSVPEPTTLLLLGTGLIGLAGIGRKKFYKR